MSARTIINLLVAVIITFTVKGFFVLHDITDTLENDQVQQQVVTQDIGMAFDWYGLTVVDNIVKYKHNLISSTELTTKLVAGQAKKNKLLNHYYNNTSTDETELVNILRDSDIKVDAFVDKVISQQDKIPVSDTEVISEMYSLTQPAVDIINNIIDIKTQKSIETKERLYNNVANFGVFLNMAAVLAIVIGITGNFQKNTK